MNAPRLFPLALTIACITPASLAAAAEQTNDTVVRLDPMVISGSPVEAASFGVPYSVDVAGVQPLADAQLGVNASEVLLGIPGLVVQNRQNYAQDLQISIRGFGARSPFGVRGVKLIADGIPASNPDGQGQAATFNLDTADRIEVLRGPFSTIYGNHAGGVIQYFSRDGQGDPRLRASVLGGSWGTIKVGAGSEGEVGGIGYVVDVSRFETDGYRAHSAATRWQEFAKVTFSPDDQSRVTIVANGLQQPSTQDPLGLTWATYQSNPRAVEPQALTFNTRKTIEHGQGGVVYERRLNDHHRFELRGYGGHRSVVQYLAIPAGPQANTNHSGGVVDFDRAFYGAGGRWIAENNFGAHHLTLTAGLDFDGSRDDRRGYQNFVGSTFGVKGALRRDEIDTVTSIDPYVQGVWHWNQWQLSAGVRHSWVNFEVDDRYTLTNPDDSGTRRYSQTTPAVGLLFEAHPRVNLYGGVGAGFETPTLNELSYSTNGGFNFGLKPARSLQAEIGAKAFVTERTRVNLAAFQITTEDEIVVAAAAGGRTSFMNAARTVRHGVELAADSELTRHFSARGSFTWLRAVYDESFVSSGNTIAKGNRIPGIPDYAAYGEVAWKPCAGFTSAVEAVYRGKLHVDDRNLPGTAAPDYFLVNLRFAAEQTRGRWTFTEILRLDNLADRKHVASVIVGDNNGRYYEPGPGRSVYVGMQVGYRF